MSSIDNRVVNMQFNNDDFQSKSKQTLNSLDALNKGLKMEGATDGLTGLDRLANGIGALGDKFKTVSVIAITALTNIVNKAVDAGLNIAKSLTIDPITSGFQEYETNLNSIQTILANTAVAGTNLKDVNKALDELNHYADQTIYNFSEMTRNIGTFTAAGVDLKTSTEAIKGIANLAALSGSNAQQASTAMYQLSQAIASGKVSLEDWNSVVNAGMGGAVFQRALAQTAVAMGVIDKNALTLSGDMKNVTINGESFRNSIMAKPGKESWLTSGVLTNTLKQFTGDLSVAELKAMGFKDAQIASIQQMAASAKAAATEVKTLSGVFDTAREAAGSGWSETWRIVFGDFSEAKTLFTNASNVLNGLISGSADARNKLLSDWKLLGGRTVLIDAVSSAFKALTSVVTPIKQAFRQIFPATTARQLFDITNSIRDFAKNLIVSGQTADKIHRTFAGFFAILSIGWEIIKGVARVIGDMFGAASGGAGSILDVTAKIGDFFVKVNAAVKEGEALNKFFDKLSEYAQKPIKFLSMLAGKFASMFDGLDTGGGSKFLNLLKKIWDFVEPLADKVVGFFKSVGSAISDAVEKLKFKDVLDVLDTAAFAGIAVAIGALVLKIKGLFGGGGGGSFLDPIKEAFEGVTDALSSMQNTLRVATLIEIAVAIGLLTISMVALSKLNADQLVLSLSAIGIMFTELIVTMKQLEEVTSEKEIGKMIGIGAALIVLGVAVDILASSVKKLAELDWNGVAKGLTGLVVILASLVATVKFMPDDKGLIRTGLALVVLASGVKILTSAVTDMAGLSWEELAKGLTGVAALLGGLFLFTKFMEADKGGITAGIGILLLAAGIKILSDSLIDISKLNWQQIAKGLAGIAGGLVLIIGTMQLLPSSAVLGGAGLVVVSLALVNIADSLKKAGSQDWESILKGIVALGATLGLMALALDILPPSSIVGAAAILVTAIAMKDVADVLKTFGEMSWEEIAKSMVELAGALAIIAGAMFLMEGAIAGAAALIIVAASLAIMAPVIQAFGDMSLEEIGKSLLVLAGVFVVLGAAGLVLTPLVPTLLGLGAAITLLGIGMVAAGAGVFLFAAGLTALSLLGVEAANNIYIMVGKLLDLIPLAMVKVGEGILKFAQVISEGGPAITAALVTVLISLMTAIDVTAPKIIDTLFRLLDKMYTALLNNVPRLTDAGLKILIGFLTGIANNIGKVVDKATDVIVAYLNGIAKNMPRITQAGVNLIIEFVNGLAKAIRDNTDRMNDAGKNLAYAIIDGITGGLLSKGGKVAQAARDVASKALAAAKDFLDINSPSRKFMVLGESMSEGMAVGIDDGTHLVIGSLKDVTNRALDTVRTTLDDQKYDFTPDMKIHPIIEPVFELGQMYKSASQIDRVLSGMRNITIGATITGAVSTSAALQKTKDDQQASEDQTAGVSFNFTQNNTSPKALNETEIYRQTNNQLSKVKGALAAANAQ